MKQPWYAWLELARISNLPTVWTNVLAGWLLAGGAWEWGALAWLLAGGSLMYTAGMILNDAMDVKFDREHRKERPIPSGRVSAKTAWIAGFGMLAAGGLMCTFVAGACGWLVLALTAAILVYDAYHKPWAGSVLIMGSCRTLLYLVAGSAVVNRPGLGDIPELALQAFKAGGGTARDQLGPLLIWLAKSVALGGYIVGVSLVARRESAGAGTPGAAFVFGLAGLAMPFLAWGISVLTGTLVWDWLAAPWEMVFLQFLMPLVLLGVILRALTWMRTPPPSNIGRAVGFLLAGIVVVDAVALGPVSPVTALVFAASMPLLLLWQRKIAAT
jgi:4-hydroxybenzoate polyprenyltransferase